jgi:signal transduction histidine kinase
MHRRHPSPAAGCPPARRALLRAGAQGMVALLAWRVLPAAATEREPRRVLIIHSFGRDFAPFDAVIAAFRRELASGADTPVVFLEAALDAGRDIGADEQRAFAAYLDTRFAAPAPDLIVSSGAPAAQFVLRHRQQLFPEVPVLLTAIDVRFVPRAALRSRDIVAANRLDLARSFEAILRVRPETDTIAVVVGATPLERAWRREMERDTAFLAERVRFVWLDKLSLAQMKERVAALPPTGAVFYALLVVDADGVPHERMDALAELKRAAQVPVFSLFEAEMGRGVVGGPLWPQSRVGHDAARAVLRSWSAPPPAQPVVLISEMAAPVYDWRELQRWRIDEARLPPDAELRYREPSQWAAHRKEIAAAAAVIAAQAALIGAMLVQRKRRRRAEQEARTLGGRLITAYEDEGRRLARELHDDITQRLAGVAMEAAALQRVGDPAARTAAAQSIGGELAQLSRDVHALSYRLHPSAIDDLGLCEALRIECDRAARRGEVDVRFDGDVAAGAARGPSALALYRVAQEALRNALRHASPRHLRVELRAEDGGTRLSVADDGCGFDPEAPRERASLGLASMRERVALLGGRLHVHSRRGQGTTVSAWVPAVQAEPA